MTQELFFSTARERYRILQGQATIDPILKEFRFCNVFREDDKVTAWFRNNVRDRLAGRNAELIRATVVFRWFNSIETGTTLLPLLLNNRWSTTKACQLVEQMAERGERILNPAYMIKSPPGKRKAPGLFECIDNVLADLEVVTHDMTVGESLENAHCILMRYPYLGPFMAYQMVCDLRYTTVLERAIDINSWTAPGPGSARGCGRMFFNDPDHFNYNSEKDQEQLRDHMRYLLEVSRMGDLRFWPAHWPRWELSTVQHWCCEYDKYMRAFLNEGTPKQRYRPAA